jgi:hypothetical protein
MRNWIEMCDDIAEGELLHQEEDIHLIFNKYTPKDPLCVTREYQWCIESRNPVSEVQKTCVCHRASTLDTGSRKVLKQLYGIQRSSERSNPGYFS